MGLSFTALASLEILQRYHLFLVCFIITFFSFILSYSREVKYEFISSRAFKWLIIFLVVVLFSGLYAQNLEYWGGEMYAFIRAFILFFLIIQTVDNEKALFLSGKIFVFAVLISSLLSFFLIYRTNFNLLSIFLFRFTGTIYDPNDYAMVLCGVLPIAVFFAKNEKKIPVKLLFFFISISFLLFIIFTQSRGGIFAASISLFLITFLLFRKKIFITIVSIVSIIVVIGLIFPEILPSRILTFLDILTGKSLMDVSLKLRISLLKSSILVFTEHPLFGVGANNFIMYSVKYISRSGFAHNMFSEIAADLGLLGLIPYVVIIFSPFYYFPKIIKSAEIRKEKAFADFVRFFRISLIGMIITSLFLSCQTKEHLWAILGIAYAIEIISRRQIKNNRISYNADSTH